MAEPLVDQIMRKAEQAADLYHRLVLVVAPTRSGKTSALHDFRDRTGAPLINVNLLLSRGMLELTRRQRRLQLPRLLGKVVGTDDGDTILLDNIEIIFDDGLKQDPLRLLQGLSRNKTVVATWNGAIVENALTYADPDHPEYRRYPMRDLLIASPELTA
ncbi:MAG: BREX-3 system P-loop-containing protein BrxF [Rhodospirillaceae bacterium]|nr:BREX-3 system P-loop-containing protein BrxF [Rhodospirillaceae bacterium]